MSPDIIFATALFTALFLFALLFRKSETVCLKNEKSEKCIDFAVSLAVALSFSAFFSLSPFNDELLSTDSLVFIYIGKKMHLGYVPYKDLFDHKGPVLYFIQYLGTLDKHQLTLWVMEILNMLGAAVFLLKTAKLFTNKKAFQYFAVFSSIIVCGADTFDRGNYTEEWALPWIAAALFICLKALKEDKYSFKNMLWLGFGFAFVLLLRVNMAVAWVVFIPIIGIRLLIKKRWADIFKCVFGFIAGAAVVIVPTVIYELATDSFGDMLKYYIDFNFAYTASDATAFNIIAIMFVLLIEMNILLVAVSLFLSLSKKNKGKLYWFNLAFLFISLFLTSISGRQYSHYAVILIPAMIVPLVTGLEFVSEKLEKAEKPLKSASIKAVPLLCVCLASVLVFFAAETVFDNVEPEDRANPVLAEYINENTGAEDDVLVLGNNAYFYYACNRSTENKFFYQGPPVNVSDKLYEEFLAECERVPSDYIVVAESTADYETGDSNLWDFVRRIEAGVESGSFTADRFEDFTVYKRVK